MHIKTSQQEGDRAESGVCGGRGRGVGVDVKNEFFLAQLTIAGEQNLKCPRKLVLQLLCRVGLQGR